MPRPPAPPRLFPHWLLRRGEATVAVLVAAGLATMIGWWLYRGGASGRTVEIEKAQPQSAQFQVDINKAQWPELATLPGVGRKLAERIVESRETDGPFRDNNDLRRVRGVGVRTMENIRPYLLPVPTQHAVAAK